MQVIEVHHVIVHMHCAAIIRLRKISCALAGDATHFDRVFHRADRRDARAPVVHTPQMRCAKAQASRGSRPCKMISMPRTIVPEDDQASGDGAARRGLGLDAQVAFDAGDGIDDDVGHDAPPAGGSVDAGAGGGAAASVDFGAGGGAAAAALRRS
jgi:hypothetical protein